MTTELEALLVRVLADHPVALDVCRSLATQLPSLASIEAVAEDLGLGDRRRLAELLHREGYPSATRIRKGLLAILCVMRSQERGTSLDRQAWDDGRLPAAYYRSFRALSGKPWSQLRRDRPSLILRGLFGIDPPAAPTTPDEGGADPRQGGDTGEPVAR